METTRRSFFVYGLLLAVWALVVVWQAEEHVRVKDAAKTELRNRSKDIAYTLSAIIRGLQFRGTVWQDRLEQILHDLVNGRTNELVKSSELISIALLNAAGEEVASAGRPIDFTQKDILQEGEHWGIHTVTLVNPVDLGEGVTNPTVILPPRDLTTNSGDGYRGRGFPRREPPPGETGASSTLSMTGTNAAGAPDTSFVPHHEGGSPRLRHFPWPPGMSEQEHQALLEKRGLHDLALAMSTESLTAASTADLWLRCIIVILATFSVAGSGLAWSSLVKSSVLQIRLVRASELNSHLKEMNLAAAGLAHETRNPLNIIRGLAQMISKRPEAAPEIQAKSREIVEEADKVAAQLNEFINYSRPREVRRSVLALNSVIAEVVRTLNYDLEEKKIHLEIQGEPLSIEADEQLLRQALFNLLLNAIQAVDGAGEIRVVARKASATEALLEIRDNGPGVPAERRTEIFKPYFTTQRQGTGLGLAVVQQIVLAHGWEIACLANEPRGAVFRLAHLKLAA